MLLGEKSSAGRYFFLVNLLQINKSSYPQQKKCPYITRILVIQGHLDK